MSHFDRLLKQTLHRQLHRQVVVGLVVGVIFGTFSGVTALLATSFGVLIAMGNTTISLWCAQRAERLGTGNPGQNLRLMFRCELERMLLTIVSLAIALGVWDLLPLPLLGGFFAGQIVSLTSGFKFKGR